MLQEIRFQVQVLKPCESVQESSNEVLDFKTRQLQSIKVYETQFFKAIFHPIREYVFRFSFLTTLNIYKNYFKGRQRLHSCTSVMQSLVYANCDRK